MNGDLDYDRLGGCALCAHGSLRYGSPMMPELQNRESFKGEVMHSSAYKNGKNYQGRPGNSWGGGGCRCGKNGWIS